MSKRIAWRKVHIGDREWKYKIHKQPQIVEIRDPNNLKLIANFNEVRPDEEFNSRFIIVEEYCYDPEISLDEYPEFYDKWEDRRVEFVSKKFDDLKRYYFSVTPQRIKDWIIANHAKEKTPN